MADSMIENRAELIVNAFQIRLLIRLSFLIAVGEKRVLPSDHILCGDLADDTFPEERQDLRPDNMLLVEPCVFFQPRTNILFIKLKERFKRHIEIGGVLLLEGSLPFLCLMFGYKAAFALLLMLAAPVNVTRHDIPGIFALILIHRHC